MARFAKAMKEKEKKKPIGQSDLLRDELLKLLEVKEPIEQSDSVRDMLLKLLEEKELIGQSYSLRDMHLKLLEVKELIGQSDSPWGDKYQKKLQEGEEKEPIGESYPAVVIYPKRREPTLPSEEFPMHLKRMLTDPSSVPGWYMYQKKFQEGEEKLPIGESYPAVVIYPKRREPTLPSEEFPKFLAELVSSPATLVVAVEGSTDLLGKFQQFADDCLRGKVSLLHLPKRFVCRGEWAGPGDRFLLKVMVSNTQYSVAVRAYTQCAAVNSVD